MVWTTATPGVTDYTQTAGMDGATTTDNVTELAGQAVASAAAAAISSTQAALYGGVSTDTLTTLYADTALTYTAGQASTVAAGDYVTIDSSGVSYVVAATGVTDAHVTTAGGVKLYHPDGPYLIGMFGQSNAAGVYDDGPNPASALVQTLNGATSEWEGSDFTASPWTLSSPNGNSGNNNYGLARAHHIADTTGRPVFIVFDAVGGTSIDEWVDSGTSSTRYAALKTKVEAALATVFFTRPSKTTLDEIIWAQGEEDFTGTFATHLGNLILLRNQWRAETWFPFASPVYMMGPSNLHDRYVWQNAMQYFCGKVDNMCIFVPSNGLRTVYSANGVSDTPGAGDFTHFLGESLWEAGYTRIAQAAPAEVAATLFYGRGDGPATAEDPTALATFSSLVSFDSWTSETNPNGPAATGSISWGLNCEADGNYSYALGDNSVTNNLSSYGMIVGRDMLTTSACDYFGGFGYQNTLAANYSLVAGRGHVVSDVGGVAVGLFSEYATAQIDDVMFQVGIGGSTGSRANAFAVRDSGTLEAKSLPTFADNAAAITGSMSVGQMYKTAAGAVRIVV